jgi:aspartate aminotransferase-like enzyme
MMPLCGKSAPAVDSDPAMMIRPSHRTEPIRFFLPGPSYVTEETRQAMTAPVVGHRSNSFREVYARMAAVLPTVFRTRRDVPIVTGSATLAMELVLVSTVRSSVLHLVSGAFSERWHAIGTSLGRSADRLDVPWGHPVDPDLVRRALRRKRYEAVTVVHNETSTGVIHPLAEIARAVREESDALVVVDAVSSLGGAPVETDAWGLDVVLTGSQKALAAPPGLAPFTASERAEARAAAVEHRGWYTDLLRYLEEHRGGGTITTPAVPVAYALERQLRRIAEEGIEARWGRHERLRDRVARWLEGRGGELGFAYASEALAAAPGIRSPTVTCLRPPARLAASEVVARLAERGFTLGGGYGAWKGSTFRIGHMGEVAEADLDDLLAAIEESTFES